MIKKHPFGLWICVALCAFMAHRSDAQDTYNRFGPANGVLVGDTNTPITTAAESSDIISLWSGSCSSTSFLRGDGSCASPAGAGTVTSVGLTVPTGLSVTGSPITSSGTLAISTTLNGLLRGTGSGFATAASSNVIPLWSGTCDATTFLRGDGSCASPAGAGTVTSVGLTVPTGLSVTGSPVTGSGSLGITTTLNGVLRGTGTGFATAAASNITALWSGTCNSSSYLRGDGSCASPGGAGTVTSVGLTVPTGFSVTGSPVTGSGSLGITTSLSGLLAGTGSGIGTANSASVTGVFSGTCSSTTFLRGDGSCQAIAAPPSSANPTGTIGLTAVNGAASTYSRSDSAPALSQAIAPTWTAKHIFSNTGTFAAAAFAASFTSADPFVQWYETDGALNNKNWIMGATSEQFQICNLNDNGTGGLCWLTADRTGTDTDEINLVPLSGVVKVNGTSVRDAGILSSGTVPVARGGTGTTTSTGTGSVVLSSGATIAATAVTVGGSNVCRQNGTNCPSSGALTAYGVIAVSGGACTLSGTYDSAGISSCTYNAAGSYNVNLTSGTGTQPTCTATTFGTIPYVMTTAGVSTTVARVQSWSLAGAATDNSFSVHCVSN